MSDTYKEIYGFVKDLEIIDTHEHLPWKEDARDKNTDILKEYLSHYFSCDLKSAGLSQEDFNTVVDNSKPILERWKIAEQYWEAARNTGYGRALDITVRDLYGIDSINGSTIEKLDEKFQESLKGGQFKRVLKEMSNIKISILDGCFECDREFFVSTARLDHFIYPRTRDELVRVENDTKISISSFEDWLEACEKHFYHAIGQESVAVIKVGLAYMRTLKYDRVTRNDAEKGFLQVLNGKKDWGVQISETGKPFQDYMMHFMLRLANKENITVQVHTGIHEGNGNHIRNSDPTLMTNLFLEYSDIDFDIFHIGYPYQQTLSVLSKNFPNVFIDMCWANIISPQACVTALVEWLDAVPANKISAFGGDYCMIDPVYGHQYIARENISKALAIKVDDRCFNIDRAKEIAQMLFYDNPMRIFKLSGKV